MEINYEEKNMSARGPMTTALLLIATVITPCVFPAAAEEIPAQLPDPDDKMTPIAAKTLPEFAGKSVKQLQEDFRKHNLGMFIHYNMATYTGDEWVRGYPDPSTFNPGGKVDTDACSGKRGLAPETRRATWITWRRHTRGTPTTCSTSARIGRARLWSRASRH